MWVIVGHEMVAGWVPATPNLRELGHCEVAEARDVLEYLPLAEMADHCVVDPVGAVGGLRAWLEVLLGEALLLDHVHVLRPSVDPVFLGLGRRHFLRV